MARGGVGGDYQRDAINRGTAIIRGNRVGSQLLKKKKKYIVQESSQQYSAYSLYKICIPCTTTLLFECLGAQLKEIKFTVFTLGTVGTPSLQWIPRQLPEVSFPRKRILWHISEATRDSLFQNYFRRNNFHFRTNNKQKSIYFHDLQALQSECWGSALCVPR